MNIAQYSIANKVVTWLVVIILLGGGFSAYDKIGKLEDPAFTIKEAKVITLYPGATAEEVESEVTFHVEDALQQMEQLKQLKMTVNRPGYSEVTIEFQDKYKLDSMPAIYDEVRRKITDMENKLPPGAMTPIIYDDFADVYGLFLTLSGDGYSYRDLKDFADILKKQLVLVDGVRKIVIGGEQKEQVNIFLSRSKLAELGINPDQIASVLQSQNVASPAGKIRVESDYIRIHPTGELKSVSAIGDVLIAGEGKQLVRLKDIAAIERRYIDEPNMLYYRSGKPALTLGISMQSGVNVVAVGERLNKRFAELLPITPVGMQIEAVYDQPHEVDNSVKGFIISVVQALLIVVVVLLFFMGVRVGLIIGAVLLITVAGTIWIMQMAGMELQRISLGALIIALGMLVDNAIVVAEGMLVRIKGGMDASAAAGETVDQTIWPLLGGTVIGILAFSGIGFSISSVGEFAGSLFWVILISLSLSWFTAITTTPLLCAMFIKGDKKPQGEEPKDPYAGALFQGYKKLLLTALRFRWITVTLVVTLFVSSVVGFGYIKQGFFPDSNTPMFFVDLWEVEGTDIRDTRDDALKVEQFLLAQPGVVSTTTVVGGGATRFTLVYGPESATSSYAQIIVKTENREQIAALQEKVSEFMRIELPDTEPKVKNLRIGPGRDAKIEARFSGPDQKILRQLSEQAQEIMFKDSDARDIRDDWRQPVKVIRPIFNEQVARQLGISRKDLTEALQRSSVGSSVGTFRDGNRLLDIVLRAPLDEREDVAKLSDIQVFSQVLNRSIPMGQVVSHFETVWENNIIRNRNRAHTIIASCNPKQALASPLFNRLRPQIEAIQLPSGYMLEWGGEYEDGVNASEPLFAALPGAFLLMIITTLLLFGRIRQPLIIWLVVPMAVIGITAGLLMTGGAFDFMALLGALSLVGLLIKNAIVLIEEIDLQKEQGKELFAAVIESSVARMRPVLMAASTTILGLIPLLVDVFFVNMAITIMAGLGFATILTLIIIPVLYAIFYKAQYREPV
ncbi:efflux RND transporter permease subunit [Psychromonas aquimarina]|uniref:efflux RND transporter permease subunit n=1 Tax=Psychromonas aquimarina TaxID=444919 RepID=UPI0003FCA9DE|nr:efflux RND transporter permease subunit [Psychromonas aquimarina]